MKSSVTTNDEQQLQSFSTESLTARKIVDEILHFGVSQTQLIIIIKLLALELEDLQLMKKIAVEHMRCFAHLSVPAKILPPSHRILSSFNSFLTN